MLPLPASKRLPISPHSDWLQKHWTPLTQTQPWIYTTLQLSPGLPPPMLCARACVSGWSRLSEATWLESLSLFPLLHWVLQLNLLSKAYRARSFNLLSHFAGPRPHLQKTKIEPDQFNIIDHFWFVICLRKSLVICPVFLCFLNGVRTSVIFPPISSFCYLHANFCDLSDVLLLLVNMSIILKILDLNRVFYRILYYFSNELASAESCFHGICYKEQDVCLDMLVQRVSSSDVTAEQSTPLGVWVSSLLTSLFRI